MADDIIVRLRQTRADMIGTDDCDHYFDCHDAANEIEKLRDRIAELESQLPKPPREVSEKEAEEACKILNTMPPKVYSMAKKIFGDYLEQGVDRLLALVEVKEIAESLKDGGWEERKEIK